MKYARIINPSLIVEYKLLNVVDIELREGIQEDVPKLLAQQKYGISVLEQFVDSMRGS